MHIDLTPARTALLATQRRLWEAQRNTVPPREVHEAGQLLERVAELLQRAASSPVREISEQERHF